MGVNGPEWFAIAQLDGGGGGGGDGCDEQIALTAPASSFYLKMMTNLWRADDDDAHG